MSADAALRVRREPPAFRELVVARTEARTPYLTRVTVGGPKLAGFDPPAPGGSVRLLLPERAGGDLVIPVWNGNAFFHADGRRPLIRTLTPLRHDPDAHELDLEVVIHDAGPLSQWAGGCQPGDPVALSGPGRGYTIAGGATTFFLAGDESAMPALGQLVDALPPPARATVVVEIAHPEARLPLTETPNVDVRWVDRRAGAPPGDALVAAVVESEIAPATRMWAAGEAAAMQRIRRHLFEVVGRRRSEASVRGYWKEGRSSSGEDDA